MTKRRLRVFKLINIENYVIPNGSLVREVGDRTPYQIGSSILCKTIKKINGRFWFIYANEENSFEVKKDL